MKLNVPIAIFGLCTALAIAARAQTFTAVFKFDGMNGKDPSGVIQGADGNFYGTTGGGGAHGNGTVFELTPAGRLTLLHSFCFIFDRCPDGFGPNGLVLGTDGEFYGTTFFGGADGGSGTLFKITIAGVLTTLRDELNPNSALVEGIDGDFYGTTEGGGGTIFKITPDGTLTTLYTFCSRQSCTGGYYPSGGLVLAADGNFYGTTIYGGAYGWGTVYRITPGGILTTLHSFCANGYPAGCTDGAQPMGGVIQAMDGNFYGTTYAGGVNCAPQVYCGTVFEITAAGSLTTLHSFEGTDGSQPEAGLIQATDGNFYGSALTGGTGSSCEYGCGTVFKMTPSGEVTTLHNFDDAGDQGDGAYPSTALLQATNGTIYGTAEGTSSRANRYGLDTCELSSSMTCGTIFSLDMGLGPFVTFVRAVGKVGQTGGILGQGFTGTTSVTINGIAANFSVISGTFIKATIPPGATTGYVTVTTPTGVLTSNVPFNVIR